MNVNRAPFRPVEHPLRQKQPVCDDDQTIGRLAQSSQYRFVAERLRLVHDRAGFHRCDLDRTRFQASSTSGRTIGLCQHMFDSRAAVDQSIQRRNGKLGRAGEYDTWVGAHTASIPLGELR